MADGRVRLLLVTGAGTGLLPKAPGTWGSAAAVGLWLLAARGVGGGTCWLTAVTAAGVLAAGAACVWLSPWAIGRAGRRDPHFVVADEWAGQWVALILMPLAGAGSSLAWGHLLAVAGVQFALFRLFDVVKPFPVRQLERLDRGWGILADDLMAGLYANVVGQLLFRLWPVLANTMN